MLKGNFNGNVNTSSKNNLDEPFSIDQFSFTAFPFCTEETTLKMELQFHFMFRRNITQLCLF